MHARLFITGVPRSGTRWVTTALRSAGLRVGHERMLREGMVSGIHCVEDFYYVNRVTERLSELTFDHLWLQTRHPLATIPSIARALRVDFWRWQEKHTGVRGDLEPVLLRAMLFWNAWVPRTRSLRHGWQYKLEDFELIWPEMCDRLGLKQTELPPNRFSSGARRVTWDDLEAVSKGTTEITRKLAYELGYPT